MSGTFDWNRFKEGIKDEAAPIGGAIVGAGLAGIRGAALGTAAGGLGSLAYSKLRGEEISPQRKMLAMGALGLGLGAGTHVGLEHMTKGLAKANPAGMASRVFHPHVFNAGIAKPTISRKILSQGTEELLPAVGGTLGTGIAYGTSQPEKTAMMNGFFDELGKITFEFDQS